MTIQKGIQFGVGLIFAVTLVSMAFRGSWDHTLLLFCGMLLCGLPWGIQKLFRVRIPENGQVITVLFIFASQYLGSFVRFYDRFVWWDIALHFISGFLLAYWGLVVTAIIDRKQCLYQQNQIGLLVMIAFLSGSASAALWESVEFLADFFAGSNAQLGSLSDTMVDIICGTIGGGLFAAYVGLCMKKKRKSLVDHLFRCNAGSSQAK